MQQFRRNLPAYCRTMLSDTKRGTLPQDGTLQHGTKEAKEGECRFGRDTSFDNAEAFSSSSHGSLKLGDKFLSSMHFSKEDVLLYARLCGDTNPIHTQGQAANESGFPGCVVHGMLHAGIFPAIIGSRFPGAVYVSQTLNFRGPVFVDEDLHAEVTIKELVNLKKFHKVTFSTTCYKKAVDLPVVDGIAVALLPADKFRVHKLQAQE